MLFDKHSPVNVLTLHPDPLVQAGIVASLRQHGGFEVFDEGLDRVNRNGTRIDVVIADYHDAMRLPGTASQGADGALADARVLVLTSDDREANVRRAIEAGIHGYL